MRPDDQTTRAFLYCLAVSARRSQVQVIFFLAMSNHYHAGIFDPEGRLPAFLEHFHKLFARHQNALRGRWENFWSSEQTSVVELLEAEDVLNEMVYTLANPVKAALVALCSRMARGDLLDRAPSRRVDTNCQADGVFSSGRSHARRRASDRHPASVHDG